MRARGGSRRLAALPCSAILPFFVTNPYRIWEDATCALRWCFHAMGAWALQAYSAKRFSLRNQWEVALPMRLPRSVEGSAILEPWKAAY